MIIWDFFLAVLATGGLLEAWFTGSLFSEKLAALETVSNYRVPFRWVRPPGQRFSRQWCYFVFRHGCDIVDVFFARLLTCPFCLSYHVGFWLGGLVLLAHALEGTPGAYICRGPLYWLAIVRLSNLIDGGLPNRLKYKPDLHFGASTDAPETPPPVSNGGHAPASQANPRGPLTPAPAAPKESPPESRGSLLASPVVPWPSGILAAYARGWSENLVSEISPLSPPVKPEAPEAPDPDRTYGQDYQYKPPY